MKPLSLNRSLPMVVMLLLGGCSTFNDVSYLNHQDEQDAGGQADTEGSDVEDPDVVDPDPDIPDPNPDVADPNPDPDGPLVDCGELDPSKCVVEVTASHGFHTCARMADGSARCWGANGEGQLGDGSRTFISTSPIIASELTDVAMIAVGEGFTCALDNEGLVSCVGRNSVGQLGNQDQFFLSHSHLALRVFGLEGVLHIDAGGGHACAIVPPDMGPNREVWCWGANDVGQTGPEDGVVFRPKRVPLPDDTDPVELVLGGGHSCVRTATDTVWCWGYNAAGVLGRQRGENGDTEVCDPEAPSTIECINTPCDPCPGFVPGLHAVSSLSAGTTHTCAVNAEEGTPEVWCWGDNSNSQLGIPEVEETSAPRVVDYFNTQGLVPEEVAVGDFHSCASVDGRVYCWGFHSSGQLGIGPIGSDFADLPTLVPTSRNTEELSLGHASSCARVRSTENSDNHLVFCWGFGGEGQIGNGTLEDRDQPVEVEGLNRIRQVDTAGSHSCALNNNDEVFCWGSNEFAQLGEGTPLERATPQVVVGLEDLRGIAAGHLHTCAIGKDGALKCWGEGSEGQLGDGSKSPVAAPVSVDSSVGVVEQVSAGYGHTCALDEDGELRCWGLGDEGQLGDGTGRDRNTPASDAILVGVRKVAVGGDHTCALMESGQVKCWGENALGQLGLLPENLCGETFCETSPQDVPNMDDATALSAGTTHTCAVRADKTLWCWGNNEAGQLGDGTLEDRAEPRQVEGLSDVVAVSAGFYHTCAVDGQGRVSCWGSNSNEQLGFAPEDDLCGECQTTPGPVALSGVVQLALGESHTCALKGDGTIHCWGFNATGALGNGDFEYTDTIHTVTF